MRLDLHGWNYRQAQTSAAAYTSSMRRQKETCEILFGNTSIPIVVDERLRQIDNGPQYTGMKFGLGKRDYLAFSDKPFPKGESFRDFAGRVREFLDEKSEQHGDHTILTIGWRLSPAIFAHICRGVSLEEVIIDNANIRGPYTYG
ncbi:histidine phosphatase family protein [Nonomuraea sp. NPDC005650]|uniref:histidine phosphatase family protein n=1 Tax=Nonomuraea sp. NPDC005650 TaxID=3157045 RepID=UPI0033B004C2